MIEGSKARYQGDASYAGLPRDGRRPLHHRLLWPITDGQVQAYDGDAKISPGGAHLRWRQSYRDHPSTASALLRAAYTGQGRDARHGDAAAEDARRPGG